MNLSKFKGVELKYKDLKSRLDNNEIDKDEMKKELKKIMVLDEDGNYWMIGGKSGKWYVYNGTSWEESDPYKEESQETAISFQKEDEDILSISENIICKFCKSKIPTHSVFCSFCGGNQRETGKITYSKPIKGISDLLIKSVNTISLIFFFGGMGLIIGVLFGAIFGIFKNIFGDLIYQFPTMLQETAGKVQGGLIFGAMGGIAGFIIFSILALIFASIYNAVSYFFGGIRLKIKS